MINDQMADLILQAMKQKGWRITDQRKSLATLFAASKDYLSPTDVYDVMKEQYPGISFDTVYRNLRLLSEMGVLEQIHFNDGVKFKACCHTVHHHHLICLDCQKSVSFDFCPMEHLPNIPSDFQIDHHKFELFGYCAECMAQRDNKDPNK